MLALEGAMRDVWGDAVASTDGSSRSVPMFPEYRNDPVGFYRDILGDEVWESERDLRVVQGSTPEDVYEALKTIPKCGQADLLRAIADELVDHTCVVAAKGPGKTWTLGRLPLWWLHTRKNSVVVIVSATGAQVSLQVIGEMETALDNSKRYLGGRLVKSPVPVYRLGPNHYCVGLSPAKPEGLQGWHAEAKKDGLGGPVLVIVDETSGIRDDILEATFGLLTNPGSAMVWSSNAKRASGAMFDQFHPLSEIMEGVESLEGENLDAKTDDEEEVVAGETRLLRITAYDAPDWIIGDRWIRGAEARPAKRGSSRLNDFQFRFDALGLFPTSDDEALFPRPFLESCSGHAPSVGGLHVGIDLGRHGRDPCIATLVENGVPVAVKRWSDQSAKRDLMRSAKIIRNLVVGLTWTDPGHENRGWDVEPRNVHIDATGMGWGVVDRLWEMGLQVDAVDFGSWRPTDDGYRQHRDYWKHVLGDNFPVLPNRRLDLYWVVRRCMEESLAGVPRVAEFLPLWEELLATEGGLRGEKFWMPPKEKIVEALGRSPDYADSYVVSFSRSDPMAVRIRTLGPSAVLVPPKDPGRLVGGRLKPRSKKAAARRRKLLKRR